MRTIGNGERMSPKVPGNGRAIEQFNLLRDQVLEKHNPPDAWLCWYFWGRSANNHRRPKLEDWLYAPADLWRYESRMNALTTLLRMPKSLVRGLILSWHWAGKGRGGSYAEADLYV